MHSKFIDVGVVVVVVFVVKLHVAGPSGRTV